MKYQELRDALAAGPTPGPWVADKFHPRILDSASGSQQVLICQISHNTRNDEGRKNEAYIAAADPDTLRALLAERDALREALTQADALVAAHTRPGDDIADTVRAAARAALSQGEQT